MQFSGVVDVFTVKTLLAVSSRCLAGMHGGGEMPHDFAVLLFYLCFLSGVCYTDRVESVEIC